MINLRITNPDSDFFQLAAWFTVLEGETSTESGLGQFYENNKDRIFSQVAVGDQEDLIGFFWVTRNQVRPEKAFVTLFVTENERCKGVGSRLYEEMIANLRRSRVNKIQVNVPDNIPQGYPFAQHRGFTEHLHLISMELDLDSFDDRRFDGIIDNLQSERFVFTSVETLGNTEEVQRKLYALNDMTSMETPGSTGDHTWDTFEIFKKCVCQADWFIPAGQMVVIDSHTGDWVGLSAITQFKDCEFAYNLHTGVDKRYRGRKIAQGVKVTALRFARDVLGVHKVRTHHNTLNQPIIAIDTKMGYRVIPGYFAMEKTFE